MTQDQCLACRTISGTIKGAVRLHDVGDSDLQTDWLIESPNREEATSGSIDTSGGGGGGVWPQLVPPRDRR